MMISPVIVYSLAIALVAIAIVAAIIAIVLRTFRTRIEAHRSAARTRLFVAVLAEMETEAPSMSLLAEFQQDFRVAADLLGELAEMLKGHERDRLFALATSAGLGTWLRARLMRGNQDERRFAANTLRFFKESETVTALTQALDDRNNDVRLTAALALVDIDAAPSLAVLIDKLDAANREQSRQLYRLLEKLAINGSNEVVAIAEGTLGHPSLQTLAIDALGFARRFDAVEALVRLARHEMTTVRAAAVRAIATLEHPSILPIIDSGLGDPAWEVRAEAADAAARMGLFNLVPRIIMLLDDDSWWVRFRAAEALGKLGEAGIDALRAIVQSDRSRAAQAAAAVLAGQRIA
jgi:HEAT repeat protein